MKRIDQAAHRVLRAILAFVRNVGGGRRSLCEMLEPRTLLTVPVPLDFDFHFETTHRLDVDFNIPVHAISNPLENTDLTLEKVTTDTNVPASSIVLDSATGTHRTFTFASITGSPSPSQTILLDGNYRASISKQEVVDGTDQMSIDAIGDFYVFAADFNRDRNVDLDDFNILATNFGTSGHTFSDGDATYDGTVNLDDFNVMASRFGTSVSALPSGPNEITVGARTDFKFDTSWLDTITNPAEQGWRVQCSLTGQFNDAVIEDLPANSTGWTTDAFGDGTRVWFRSRAYGNGQDTAYTPKRYAITHLPVPTITTVTALSSTQIKVEFTDNSQNETHFQVYRSLNPAGPFSAVGSPILSGQPTQFIDSGLNPSTSYYYYVRARNAVIDSSPSPTGFQTTQPATAFVDLDVFEDVNGDFIHDNSAAAEVIEGNQPTALPYLEEDGDYQRLALVVNGAIPSATITFNYQTARLQLYQDVMGLYPLNPGQAIPLSNLGLGSGSDTVVLFAKLTSLTGPEQTPGMVGTLGGGSTGSTVALGGDVARRITSDPNRPDELAWHDGVHDNEGGLDDGDGPNFDTLTDRDGFWSTHANKRTLVIGFSGHRQSAGTHGTNGRIWNIFDGVGAHEIGENIRDQNPGWAVTMFPEDAGNDSSAVLARCGDGVLGRANPYFSDARVDANNNPTGALSFLVDAIVVRGVREVGLFGYSHGGGSLQLLMQALAYRADTNTALRDKLIGAGGPPIRFFWSATIDAVNITFTVQGGQITDAFGTAAAETQYPFGVIPQGPFIVGTEWHYNAHQLWAFWPFGDGVPISGTELDPEDWLHHSSRLRQDYCEQPHWPRSTDHTNDRGRGIAEDDALTGLSVRDRLLESLAEAFALLP